MPSSRQDQLHSHQYAVQRVVAALVAHDPDPARSPLRRAGSTALISLLVAAVAVGGTAAYGLITGRQPVNPRDETAVYTEKESGAQYVYLRADDRLHPVLNFTSALLVAGAPRARKVDVPRRALARVPLGAPLGIPGAPASLPGPKDLVKGPWTVCTEQPATPAGAAPRSLLVVGTPVAGGTPAATPRPGAASQALLVTDPDDKIFLVYGDRRFLIPPARVQDTRAAFGWNAQRPVAVAAAWINAVPAGPDVTPPAIAQLGGRSSVPGVRVGRLFRAVTSDGRFQWAVAMPDGVADLTEVQAALLDSQTRSGDRPVTVSTAAFGDLPRSATLVGGADVANGLPATVPALADVRRRLCLVVPPGADSRPEVRIDPDVPSGAQLTATGDGPGTGRARVDAVYLPRTGGALVEAAASPTAPAGSGTVSIVLDTGVRHPMANSDVPATLGYGGVTPLPFPAELVALLPKGPALDPAQARRTQTDRTQTDRTQTDRTQTGRAQTDRAQTGRAQD